MAEATLMLILACLYDLPGKVTRFANGSGGRPVMAQLLDTKAL